MKIENYDTQEEESNFKQIYQFISDLYFKMLLCAPS